MVKAEDYLVFRCPPPWKPPDLNGTGTSLQPMKPGLMTSYVNPGFPFSPLPVGFPELSPLGTPNSKIHHESAASGSVCYLPSYSQRFPPILNPAKGNASFVSVEPGGNYSYLHSSGKKYIVFDQSCEGTRLFYGSHCPLSQRSEVLERKQHGIFHGDKKELPVNLAQFDLVNPNFVEESGENYVSGEESEMHEDTEEINALLYSDDDDDDYDKGEEGHDEDEVTSTGRAPTMPLPCCWKRSRVEDSSNELRSSGCLNKRHKAIGGECNRFNSSLIETPSTKFDGFDEHEIDPVSCSIRSRAKGEDIDPILGGELSKKDKIRQTMKILEGIVPGAEGKNPIFVLDEAIQYLKTMKLKAEVLGMNFN